LREDIFPALGRTKVEIAKLLGVSRRALYNILDEKTPITPQMALRIGKLTGSRPELWLDLQRTYDLRVAEKSIGKKLGKIPTLKAA
jgi:addiction module HigA family antidote